MISVLKGTNRKRKNILSIVLSVLIVSMCLSQAIPQTAEAASQKAVKTVTLKVNGKKVNSKTITIKKGSKVKVAVTVNPVSAKQSASYVTSKKKIATVSKGTITGKAVGTSKISVKVKAKNGKLKTAWLKVKVIDACKHKWKAHKVSKEKWVPNIVTVDNYKTVEGAQLYRKVSDTEFVSDGPIFWMEDGYTWDDFNEMCFEVMVKYGGMIGDIDYSGYVLVYKQVKVPGTHTEDQGYYVVTSHTDYYYCTKCGAKK